MTIRITQLPDVNDDPQMKERFLVEGSLDLSGAKLIAELCRRALKRTGQVTIDLSGVGFIDESGAEMLRRLKRRAGISMTGSSLFTRLLIEGVEAASSSARERGQGD